MASTFTVTSKKVEKKKCHQTIEDFLSDLSTMEWENKEIAPFLNAIAPFLPDEFFEKNVLTLSFFDHTRKKDDDDDADEYVFTVVRSKNRRK